MIVPLLIAVLVANVSAFAPAMGGRTISNKFDLKMGFEKVACFFFTSLHIYIIYNKSVSSVFYMRVNFITTSIRRKLEPNHH